MAENGHNIEPLKQDISEGYQKVVGLREERKAINDKIQAIRTDLEAKGIAKPAFDMAMRYVLWDPDKRAGFDLAYSIAREALGTPVDSQGDIEDFIKKPKDEPQAPAATQENINEAVAG